MPFPSMDNKNVTAKNVAEYFLALSSPEEGDIISNLKIQKLVYYAQGYHLALYDRPFFGDKIVAWEHGPVVESLYHDYKKFGSGAIEQPQVFDSSNFTAEQHDLVKEVYKVLGQFSGWKLRNMTHSESPWLETPKGQVIEEVLMKDYFKTQLK